MEKSVKVVELGGDGLGYGKIHNRDSRKWKLSNRGSKFEIRHFLQKIEITNKNAVPR